MGLVPRWSSYPDVEGLLDLSTQNADTESNHRIPEASTTATDHTARSRLVVMHTRQTVQRHYLSCHLLLPSTEDGVLQGTGDVSPDREEDEKAPVGVTSDLFDIWPKRCLEQSRAASGISNKVSRSFSTLSR